VRARTLSLSAPLGMANSTLTPGEILALKIGRDTSGTLSCIGGLVLTLLCHQARKQTSEPNKLQMLHLIMQIAFFDLLCGLSFPLGTIAEAFYGSVSALCNISLVLWCYGTFSSVYTAFFAHFLQRSLVDRRPPLSSCAQWTMLILTYLAATAWGAITLFVSGGTYSCHQWLQESSFGVWGMVAYVVYGSALFLIALYITFVFCRIVRSFQLVRRATSEALLAERSAREALLLEQQHGGVRTSDGLAGHRISRASALEDLESVAARTSAKLDSRLARYLLAYLVCNVPVLVQTLCLALVHFGIIGETPIVVLFMRWTLQPLQGFWNLLVYWNLPGRAAATRCCRISLYCRSREDSFIDAG
jgi:hypothetical protein